MLGQNYLKVFINGGGTVTIASAHGESADFQTLEVETITVSTEDIGILSLMLSRLLDQIEEEERNA